MCSFLNGIALFIFVSSVGNYELPVKGWRLYMKIFIVEDDNVIAGAIEGHLTSWGYECSCATWWLQVTWFKLVIQLVTPGCHCRLCYSTILQLYVSIDTFNTARRYTIKSSRLWMHWRANKLAHRWVVCGGTKRLCTANETKPRAQWCKITSVLNPWGHAVRHGKLLCIYQALCSTKSAM